MRLKQSVCLPLFVPEDMSLDDACATAARIGYRAVEIWQRDEGFERLVATAKQHGLAVSSMCGHYSLEDGLNRRENHERIEKELIESIDLAAEVGIPGIICFSGNRNQGQSEHDGMVACAEGLRRAAPHAEKKGVNLNLELLNSKVDHPGYQCDRSAWGVSVCERVGSPRVKLLYDIYHMQIMEGDVIRTIRGMIQHTGHFHTAGNPGRHEMDDTQELNYRGICRAIVDSGYKLYVGHELAPLGDVVAALRDTFAICDV